MARRNGVAPNLLYRWRRLMLEGGAVAVSNDDEVTSNRAVRPLEEWIRELERQLGRKTLEAEVLKEALDKARPRKPTWLVPSPVKVGADEGGGCCSRGGLASTSMTGSRGRPGRVGATSRRKTRRCCRLLPLLSQPGRPMATGASRRC